MLAAAESVKTRLPKKTLVAVPAESAHAIELLASKVDQIVCLNVRSGPIFAVADTHEDWYDVSDDEVLKYLGRARKLPSTIPLVPMMRHRFS